MTDPTNTPMDLMKSMVDHPAGRAGGRHRTDHPRTPTAVSCHGPRYRGPHGDDHTVGHARPRRDATPGLALFEAIGLLLVICAVILLPLVIIVAAWHLAGWWGAGGATAIWIAVAYRIVKRS